MKKINNGDKNAVIIRKYIEAGRCKLDVDGIIGESCACKTNEYISWYSTEAEAMKLAKTILLNPENYGGKLQHHDYIPGKTVIICDQHSSVYVKAMIYNHILWIAIHLHDFDKF